MKTIRLQREETLRDSVKERMSTAEISNIKIENVDGKLLVYKRRFFFGGGGNILFPVTSYAAVKNLFDAISKADNHTITLKQTAATAKSN